MGYVSAIGPCKGCGRIFSFNPHRVPSIVLNGVREPICRDCVEHFNPMRIANGLPAIISLPDAYEAIDEHEL